MAALCKKWWQRSDRSWWARRRNSQSLDRRSILPNILYFRFTFAKDFRFTNLCAFILTVNGHSNIIATQSKFGQKVGFAKRFTFEIWDLVLPNMFGQEFGFAKRFVVNSVRMHHRQRQRRQLVAFTLWIVTLVPIPNLKAAKHHIFQLFYISIFLKYWNLPGKKS